MISASLAYQAPCPPPPTWRWSTSGWSSPWPSLSLKWLCTPTKRPSSWSWTSSGSHMTSPLQCLPKSNQWNDSSLSTRPKKMFKGLLAIKSICFDFYGKVEKENDILWASFGQGAPFCSNRSFLSFSLGPILQNLKISKPFRIFFYIFRIHCWLLFHWNRGTFQFPSRTLKLFLIDWKVPTRTWEIEATKGSILFGQSPKWHFPELTWRSLSKARGLGTWLQNDLSEIKLIWMWFQFPLIVGYQLYFLLSSNQLLPSRYITQVCKKIFIAFVSFQG